MLYQISNGCVAFADNVVLNRINFEIRDKEKIAVVGRNGCGKTTLLKLISGEVELTKRDSDQDIFIAKAGKPEIGYMKQITFEDPELSMEAEIQKVFAPVEKLKEELESRAKALETSHSEQEIKEYTALQEYFESIGGYYYKKEYEILVTKFGFSQEDKKKPLNQFSGGQQTKIAFIKLLLSKPDILLLDEPTNHLDVETVEWLESYIKNYPKAVVVVSHDRMFLDNIVDVVYEIAHHTCKRYPGNYTNFVKRKKEDYEKQLKDYTAQQKEIARLYEIVEKFKNKPTKVSMARSKLKAIEHMEKIEKPERFDTRAFHAHFQPDVVTGNDVLFVRNLEIGYDHPLSKVSLDVKRGNKIGILGGNGLGKSTFLKTIIDRLPALSGSYQYGVNVQIGYFDQQMALYSSTKTVLDDMWDEFPTLTETEVRNLLGAFLFSGDDVFKTVDMLSGGEKVRLALCKIFKRKPNVLILDEPTNHMDIVGKETLESMLQEYEGTLLFVSHDRYFVKQVADRLLVFEDGTTNEYAFGYEQYQEKLDREKALLESQGIEKAGGSIHQIPGGASTSAEKNVQLNSNGNPIGTGAGKASYNFSKERSKKERQVKKLEEKLAQDEQRIEELKQELLNPLIQSAYSKLTEIQNQIDEMEALLLEDMEAWEQAASELEEMQ